MVTHADKECTPGIQVGVIAHRGGAGLRVENTLAAFANAIDMEACGAELDARLSADGEVVIHHNDCLNPSYCRTDDGQWLEPNARLPIAKMDIATLAGFDIGTPRPGSGYASRFNRIVAMPGQRIPLLRDVIQLVRQRSENFILVIEIKSAILDEDKKNAFRLVDAVLDVVEEERFFDRVRLCSFDWRALRYSMEQRPGLRTWFTMHPMSWYGTSAVPAIDIPPSPEYLVRFREAAANGLAPWHGDFSSNQAENHASAIAAAGAEAWFLYHTDCTPERISEAGRYGLESAAWSVNLDSPSAIQKIHDSGVSWVCLDYL